MRRYAPLSLLFIILTILLLIFKSTLVQAGFNFRFILMANAILFLLSALALYIQMKYLKSSNPHAFVRGVYSSVLLKMLLIIAALFIFIVAMDGVINKSAIFITMFIYVLYSSLEVFQLMKLVRKK